MNGYCYQFGNACICNIPNSINVRHAGLEVTVDLDAAFSVGQSHIFKPYILNISFTTHCSNNIIPF